VSERVLSRIAAVRDDAVYFDGMEERNGSPAGHVASARARALNRERYGLAPVGASDAHFLASVGCAHTVFDGTTADDLRRAIETHATCAATGRSPRLSELGYRNIALQQWRGMMATPRNMGWLPTIRSFVTSRTRTRRSPSPDNGLPLSAESERGPGGEVPR
jgi:hypothetical protein